MHHALEDQSAGVHLPPALSRRDVLSRAGGGLGSLALATILHGEASAAPQPPMHPATARAVIFLYMVGGPSHIETFDPKPALRKLDGEPLPQSFGEIKSQFIKQGTPVMGSNWEFNRHGRSGLEISTLYPHLATCADDLAIVRSCHSESFVHAPAMYQVVTGRTQAGHPSIGSWTTYGLGSIGDNLPAFCVMTQPEGLPEGGAPMWGSGYLPAAHQGTTLRGGSTPILHLAPSGATDPRKERRIFDYIREVNQLSGDVSDSDLDARIAAYELAYRMQMAAPEATDLSRESRETRDLYGVDQPETAEFGSRCLLARRLVERGVRFVLLFSGGGPVNFQWDAHDNVKENHDRLCRWTDRPIAALLKDLKRRGMLDSTLVVWGSEFGRTPVTQNGSGRDHNPAGYSMWLAGGGIRGGTVYGSTDEVGFRAVESPVHMRDFHATILRCLGIEHTRLTYLHNGRRERLTDIGGQVIEKILR